MNVNGCRVTHTAESSRAALPGSAAATASRKSYYQTGDDEKSCYDPEGTWKGIFAYSNVYQDVLNEERNNQRQLGRTEAIIRVRAELIPRSKQKQSGSRRKNTDFSTHYSIFMADTLMQNASRCQSSLGCARRQVQGSHGYPTSECKREALYCPQKH